MSRHSVGGDTQGQCLSGAAHGDQDRLEPHAGELDGAGDAKQGAAAATAPS